MSMYSTILDLLFPRFCLGCRREGSLLCEECLGRIERVRQRCPLCGKLDGRGSVCACCKSDNFYLDGLLAAGRFENGSIIQKCVHAFKFEFLEELEKPLAQLLFEVWPGLGDEYIICPVPLHPKRERFRGFNQSALLARQLAAKLGNEETLLEVVGRVAWTRPQIELAREERLRNVEGVFQVHEDMGKLLRGQKIVLVDDVATTMATLNACAKVLKARGAREVRGLVVARGR